MAASYSEPYISNGTGVFWDMDQCKIREGRTTSDLVSFIKQMLLSVSLRGPVSIRIYGDLTGLDFQASDDPNVKLNHFHAGEKREKMTKILEDIVAWSSENPEPSTGILFLGHLEAADDADITAVTEVLKTQEKLSLCDCASTSTSSNGRGVSQVYSSWWSLSFISLSYKFE